MFGYKYHFGGFMLLRKYFYPVWIAAFLLFFSHLSYSHEGHKVDDITLTKLGDLGKVEFPVSCNKTDQQAMNTGVALLHHMMYAQAEMFFKEWIAKSPDCAMFYWGYSMSLFHPLWPDTISSEALARGLKSLAEAIKLNVTQREEDYIQAAEAYYKNWQNTADKIRVVNWANAQKNVFLKNPNDIDAVAFYALSELSIASKKDTTFSQQKQAGERLNAIFVKHPTHPGAIHYSIHAYDNQVLANLATNVVTAYGEIAPDVPHALHMPSHVFVRLGNWDEVIAWNIRSANAALKYPTKKATSMHYIHAIDYLVYGYMQNNNASGAIKAIEEVKSHHPIQATFPAAYALSTIPARLALERHDWVNASQLKTRTPDYFDWDKFPQVEAITYFARGLGAARMNDFEAANKNLRILDDLYAKTLKTSPGYWAVLVDAQRQTVSAWVSYAKGDKAQALKQLKEAAGLEDSLDKNPVTPGAVLPARELLADMLMLNGDYSGALNTYQTNLKTNPYRLNSLTGANAAKKQMRKN
jgi:tetratricopeptide (TPR) repeat protein